MASPRIGGAARGGRGAQRARRKCRRSTRTVDADNEDARAFDARHGFVERKSIVLNGSGGMRHLQAAWCVGPVMAEAPTAAGGAYRGLLV